MTALQPRSRVTQTFDYSPLSPTTSGCSTLASKDHGKALERSLINLKVPGSCYSSATQASIRGTLGMVALNH